MHTPLCMVQVLLSQFEFKPVRSTILGSSAPGMARARELEEVTKVLKDVLQEDAPTDPVHFAVSDARLRT